MAIKISLNHVTNYHYDRQVSLSPHIFRLRPAVHSRTKIESYTFKITPKNHFINWQQDPFGNFQARVVFLEKTKELSIEVELVANMEVINPFDFFVEESASEYPFKYAPSLKKELVAYFEITDKGPLLLEWVKKFRDFSEIEIIDYLVLINQSLNKAIKYTIRLEPGVQTPEDTLKSALGSCRDSAWLLVQIFRHLGIAARFVSGYLVQLVADIKPLDGPSGPEKDFTDLHAWVEVYLPGAGWVGLDPTSGLFAGEGHIPLACTPHYASAAPVVGATDVCKTEFSFSNNISRIHEDPRVTKPYSEQQWQEIDALGNLVDAYLLNNDVRLTMGGEPTFVSADDMESAQWNTTADGKHKRILAHELILKLRKQFGPTGLIHYGQGKWYPGEPLPRWQYGLYWRKDGYPVWRNEKWLATEITANPLTHKDAEKFITELAKALAVHPLHAMPAFEDMFYFLWSEGKVPVNIDPLKTNVKDSLERHTLAKLLQQGLDVPSGYVLPLEWDYWHQGWKSCKWEMRLGSLMLIPGNSPIGLRLPLDSIPYNAKTLKPQEIHRDLFESMPELDHFHDTISERYDTISDVPRPSAITQNKVVSEKITDIKSAQNKKQVPAKAKETEETIPEQVVEFDTYSIKTSLCIEPRDGILYIFIPPLSYLEHYLDLIASIEATAERMSMPVRIEGYEPPKDYRLEKIVVSPDPGVIEVNIHPSRNWMEMKSNIDILYNEAFLSRLSTEKFMLDGRHTGTGGGNHITIGGITPADSPLLRRPNLLKSFIGFWQNHPGLSYLFSSTFIGPTSQAPRFDEGFHDRIYEMEIAFDQIPENRFVPYWLVDRIFRHLLTDITGNTHRAELCIDKLYSPDSSSGRLGILELRTFDMPPHKEMSLVQMLLIRALVAAFWKKPYRKPLVRWGTALYDKYLLPHFVMEDIKDVLSYLSEEGFPFEIEWFKPFFEFRFPHYGTVNINGIQLEIRMAIEPWHVLGEELGNNGTARFVDSSLERLQVKVNGLNGDRYVVLCNGARIPIVPTQVSGEFVAGVKYRAWQPPSALHPTIGIDAPLTFDIVDTWNGLSIGGCTYYVAHPGGRSYDTFPVNNFEAESRRSNRFWDQGFTPDALKKHYESLLFQEQSSTNVFNSVRREIVQNRAAFVCDPPALEINKEFPTTLDLRKQWKRNH